jgi:hypothetical protein
VTATEEFGDLDATGIDAAAAAYERWLMGHGIRYVRNRRHAMDRGATKVGHTTLVDFLILVPAPRAMVIMFKHERNALTVRQEEFLSYLVDAGWNVGTYMTAREAVRETVRVACAGCQPMPVEQTHGHRARA